MLGVSLKVVINLQKAERALASLLPKDALVNISVRLSPIVAAVHSRLLWIPNLTALQLDLRRGDGEHIQDALLKITGRRTVPQVFISGMPLIPVFPRMASLSEGS